MENNFVISLYVDRNSGRWILRDRDGRFWSLPSSENAWDEREPFYPDETADLVSVPGHYKYQLGLSA